MRPAPDAAYGELARVVREHAGSVAGSLVHLIGDFATAEDLVQDAVLATIARSLRNCSGRSNPTLTTGCG
jgi:DNA-directed RNA polymerase specialized sigma24 family protein